nr:MAG TPA: hypothetical protein [Caudoviricetes sp.]
MPNSSDSIGAISIFVSPSFANSDNRLTCCSVHLVMSATSQSFLTQKRLNIVKKHPQLRVLCP